MFSKVISIFVLFFCFNSIALTGKVMDKNGTGIGEAIIFFTDVSGENCYITKSDENGNYSFDSQVSSYENLTYYNQQISGNGIGRFFNNGIYNIAPFLNVHNSNNLQIKIFTPNGRLVKEFHFDSQKSGSLNTFLKDVKSQLQRNSKGIYFYRVTSNTDIVTQKPSSNRVSVNRTVLPDGDYNLYISGKNIIPFSKNETISGYKSKDFYVETTSLWDSNRVVLRSNYNNSRKKILDGFIRIAFLGGSITNMNGWRTNIMTYFQNKFPNTEFDFIEAGIGGKSSKYHAFRLHRDVFHKGKVDLLFFESAVNDRGLDNKIKLRTHEGIIRQARQINPEIDIIQLHFLYNEYYDEYLNYDLVPAFAAFDSSGKVYNSSMQNLARYVAERYTWQEFGSNVHPKEFGHKLYSDNIKVMFEETWIAPLPQGYEMFSYPIPSEPADSFSYYNGRFQSIDSAYDISGFQKVDSYIPSQGTLQSDWKNMEALVGTAGNKLKFNFSGSLIGVEAINSEFMGDLKFNIDNGFKTGVITTKLGDSKHKANSFIFNDELPKGEHILELEVDQNSNIVILSFLVNN